MDDSSGSANLDDPTPVLEGARRLRGMLVEFVVPEASVGGWSRVIEALDAQEAIDSFTVDALETTREVTAATFAAGRERRLAARIGGCFWTTTLASAETVDLQCDAEEIAEAWQVQEIASFMRTAARLTGRRALLLPETLDPLETRPLLVVEPDIPGP